MLVQTEEPTIVERKARLAPDFQRLHFTSALRGSVPIEYWQRYPRTIVESKLENGCAIDTAEIFMACCCANAVDIFVRGSQAANIIIPT